MDVRVHNEGTVILLEPVTPKGKTWLQEKAVAEPWQWLGANLAVDPRYVEGLTDGMKADGLEVG